jgi:hypothetical protein
MSVISAKTLHSLHRSVLGGAKHLPSMIRLKSASIQKWWLMNASPIMNDLFPLRISSRRWVALWLASALCGLVLYNCVVIVSYNSTQNAMASAGAEFLKSWPSEISNEAFADAILGQVGIDNSDVKARLVTAVNNVPINQGQGRPVMEIVQQFLHARRTGPCQRCDDTCRRIYTPILVRLLLGWPGSLDAEKSELDTIASNRQIQGTEEQVIAACNDLAAIVNRTAWTASATLFGRTDPWPAPLVAQAALGAARCLPTASDEDRSSCTLLTRLFEDVLDNRQVRWRRAGLVNFFYGYERALVFILGFVMIGALVDMRLARR